MNEALCGIEDSLCLTTSQTVGRRLQLWQRRAVGQNEGPHTHSQDPHTQSGSLLFWPQYVCVLCNFVFLKAQAVNLHDSVCKYQIALGPTTNFWRKLRNFRKLSLSKFSRLYSNHSVTASPFPCFLYHILFLHYPPFPLSLPSIPPFPLSLSLSVPPSPSLSFPSSPDLGVS